ncbi:hypothetical protein COV16_01275 [Candidatus Woesearchaeota archaeon CG10_big_fil_rev_8_21_14_0_10_34_8]|nr:MAG: hypothetical protein COV16_01275 [Candidatus Woesearchaeota archaeon CG10_big_fil_rev_8_21_14_0_10_34_8]
MTKMCRLLIIKSKKTFQTAKPLKTFAGLAKNSQEYQGHGWGCAYKDKNGKWKHYKKITPIWEDNLDQFPDTNFLIVHARSAFEDKDIVVENNMPFYDDKYIFIFNGELRGVRIKEEGRIGAEKIFNFIKSFKGDTKTKMQKAVEQIKKRTKLLKALNIIITDNKNIYVNNSFNERPNYFQMYYKKTDDDIMICSDPFPNEKWQKMKLDTIEVF